MITTLTAFTHEIDDAAEATAEILAQLDLEHNLKKNSVGILTCYSEFVESSVVQSLCASLPFEVIGGTTLGNAAGQGFGQMMLALSVLTSDENHFATAASSALAVDNDAPVAVAYTEALDSLGDKPELIVCFAPLVGHVGGDLVVTKLNEVSNGVPIFGAIASDHYLDYHTSRTIRNGLAYQDSVVMLLVGGPLEPVFCMTSIPEEKIGKQEALITASDGIILKEVNNMPLLDYLATLGLTEGGGIEGAQAIPFVVNYHDGTKPVSRAIYMFTPEGWAICGGPMQVDATLSIGSLDYDDVMRTAQKVLDEAKATGRANVLFFPCLSRNMALRGDNLAELKKMRDDMQNGQPYHVCYAGGEFCPQITEDGRLINRFHNYTLIACAF